MSLADVMNQAVTVYQAASRDKYGKVSHGANGRVYSDCRIETKTQLRKDQNGKEVVSTGMVFILGDATITINDRLVLPSGATPIVMAVEKVNDETGIHHTKVWLTDNVVNG